MTNRVTPNEAAHPGWHVHESVHAALRDLPEDQRAAIQLAYFSGLTHSEIAAQLGHPHGHREDAAAAGLWPSAAGTRSAQGLGMTQQHAWFIEHVEAFALRHLEPDEERSFRDHLERCAECRRDLDRVERELAWLPMGVTPVTLRPGLVRKLSRGVLGEREPAWRRAVPWALAASVALIGRRDGAPGARPTRATPAPARRGITGARGRARHPLGAPEHAEGDARFGADGWEGRRHHHPRRSGVTSLERGGP